MAMALEHTSFVFMRQSCVCRSLVNAHFFEVPQVRLGRPVMLVVVIVVIVLVVVGNSISTSSSNYRFEIGRPRLSSAMSGGDSSAGESVDWEDSRAGGSPQQVQDPPEEQ